MEFVIKNEVNAILCKNLQECKYLENIFLQDYKKGKDLSDGDENIVYILLKNNCEFAKMNEEDCNDIETEYVPLMKAMITKDSQDLMKFGKLENEKSLNLNSKGENKMNNENNNNNNENNGMFGGMMNGNAMMKMFQYKIMMEGDMFGGAKNEQPSYKQIIDANGRPMFYPDGQPIMQLVQAEQKGGKMDKMLKMMAMSQLFGGNEGNNGEGCQGMINGQMGGFENMFKIEKLPKGKVRLNMQGQLCYRDNNGKYISYNGKELKHNLMIMPPMFEMIMAMPCEKKALLVGDMIIKDGECAFIESLNPYKLCGVDGSVQESKAIVNDIMNLEIVSVVRNLMDANGNNGGMMGGFNPMSMFGGVGQNNQAVKQVRQVLDVNGRPAFYQNGQPILEEVQQPVCPQPRYQQYEQPINNSYGQPINNNYGQQPIQEQIKSHYVQYNNQIVPNKEVSKIEKVAPQQVPQQQEIAQPIQPQSIEKKEEQKPIIKK